MDSQANVIDVIDHTAAAPRDPFARAQPSEHFWVLLRPVFKARQLIHAEKLARVSITHQRIGRLELLRLDVRLEGDLASAEGNRLEVLADHDSRRLRFGPTAGVSIAPGRRGLGGLLLARLIDWCHRHCAEYVVTPILLPAADAEAAAIREKMLRRAGFDIQYLDESTQQARAQVRQAADLISTWDAQRVEPIDMSELLKRLREQESENLKLQTQLNVTQARIEQCRRVDLGNRFAIGCLVTFSIFQAVLLLWVVLR